MLDFMAGCIGLDPAGDDGRKYGLWPWQIEGWPNIPGAAEPAAREARPAEPAKEPQPKAPREEHPRPRRVEPSPPRPSEAPKRRLEDLVP